MVISMPGEPTRSLCLAKLRTTPSGLMFSAEVVTEGLGNEAAPRGKMMLALSAGEGQWLRDEIDRQLCSAMERL